MSSGADGGLVVALPRFQPWGLVAAGHRLWLLSRTPGGAGAIARLNPGTGEVEASTELTFDPWDFAVGEGGVWVTPNGAAGNVVRLDPASLEVVAQIGGVPDKVMGSAIVTGFGSVWVANSDERSMGGPRTVSRIDPVTNRIAAIIRVGESPQSITTGFGSVWVGDHDSGAVSRIDPRTNRVIGTVPVAVPPHYLAAGADGLWVAPGHGDALVLRIDPTSNKVDPSTRLEVVPYATIVVDDRWVWFAASGFLDQDHSVLIMDAHNRRVVRTLRLGATPMAVATIDRWVWIATRQPAELIRYPAAFGG